MKGQVMTRQNYFVHESAYIDEPASIGHGTKIWHFCHVMKGAIIGEACVLGQNTYVGSQARIGNHVRIQNNVSIYDDVILEDYVFCGPSCVFTNVINPRSHIGRSSDEYLPTHVKKGATIGANATGVCGNTIGRYAFVGAGAVVTKDVPDYALVYGTPARVHGWVCECTEKLRFVQNKSGNETARCSVCGLTYEMKDQIVVACP
jgi:UDP-2-acetamido-3-amino-2,3-dideoxy-glucuronate N-acetyltransferase